MYVTRYPGLRDAWALVLEKTEEVEAARKLKLPVSRIFVNNDWREAVAQPDNVKAIILQNKISRLINPEAAEEASSKKGRDEGASGVEVRITGNLTIGFQVLIGAWREYISRLSELHRLRQALDAGKLQLGSYKVTSAEAWRLREIILDEVLCDD